MAEAVGVIGLGIMGGAIARNLVDAGFVVAGYDIVDAKNAELAAAGGTIAKNAAAIAGRCELIVTSLPSAAALDETVAAIARAATAPRIVAECSTFTIDEKRRAADTLAASGHVLLDCPLSGTGAQAKTRDLVVLASGDAAAYERIAPVFDGFARKRHFLGAFGNGSRMKYVANHLVHIHNVASAEAILLARRGGLDPALAYEVIRDSAGGSRIFELRAPMMVAREFRPPTMQCAVWKKDMAVIGAFAREVGAPTPLFDASSPYYLTAIAEGLGDADTAAVYQVLEEMADKV